MGIIIIFQKTSIASINYGWVLLSINLKVGTFLQEFWCPDTTILKQELLEDENYFGKEVERILNLFA